MSFLCFLFLVNIFSLYLTHRIENISMFTIVECRLTSAVIRSTTYSQQVIKGCMEGMHGRPLRNENYTR